jgi:hypothetical protein
LSFGSCKPPFLVSPNLTVGTPDANGAGSNSVGSVLLRVNATPSDVSIIASTTDVRCQAGVSTCGSANDVDGSDYTGETQLKLPLRITDKNNTLGAPGGTDQATGSDTTFNVTVPCAATTSTSIGATCSITTTANTVVPGVVIANTRSIWQVDEVQLFDGGPDGVVSTADNKLFEVEGVFVP